MKATGIVRRIDDLGRVVVPKEIRRTLRIREGDPLEIFTDEGGIYFKKYSPLNELHDFAQNYTDAAAKTTGYIVMITDTDTVVAVSGISKSRYLEKPLNVEIVDAIYARVEIVSNKEDHITKVIEDMGEFKSQIICPIISEGEPVGSIVLLSTDKNAVLGQAEVTICKVAAKFIEKQLEV
jgi:AbrB family transcriptional regulator (stage V sporulation protein T)